MFVLFDNFRDFIYIGRDFVYKQFTLICYLVAMKGAGCGTTEADRDGTMREWVYVSEIKKEACASFS